jgi:beta-1,4-mannosyltransferase
LGSFAYSRLVETARHPDLIGKTNVTVYPLAAQPEWIAWGTLPFFLNIPAKVIQQFWTLFRTLMYTTPPAQWIIIQVTEFLFLSTLR